MKAISIFRALLGPILLAIPNGSHGAPPFAEFIDPNPNPGNQFGAKVVPLSTGNVVITSPYDDAGGTDAGAVYLFNGETGALIGTLTGSTANDMVGSFGVVALSNGNYIVSSPVWDRGAVVNAGAVTWGNGTTGVSGVVSSSNSLVGSTAEDRVGGHDSGLTALNNGNYLVANPKWDNGSAVDAGAVTWGNGSTGISGIVSAGNSLVGTGSNDFVGNQAVKGLTNGNYLIRSPDWANGSAPRAGAVTWGNGSSGISGIVSSTNSLVGTQFDDQIGNREIIELSNGNYLVCNPTWDNGVIAEAGAVTWGSGVSGISGAVGSGNSLVGSSASDGVGAVVTALANGNYVVCCRTWDNGTVANVGAATWGDGTTGVKGVITSANSLVGASANDRVGWTATALSNGNYVVNNQTWKNGSAANAGAVTWGSGNSGISGVVSSENSLVGTLPNDRVGNGSSGLGDGVKALSNGNYVVLSHVWDDGPVVDAGAVTWGDGSGGIVGPVDASNSLVGTTAGDMVSGGVVTVLSNGNYVVRSSTWDNGAAVDAGAVTWRNGSGGVSGAVTEINSLVGTSTNDQIGVTGVTALTNGNYVVLSTNWDHAGVANVGAVTWGNGSGGLIGPVTSDNSLIGTKLNDNVGNRGVTSLSNGNYVVSSTNWDNGAVANVGAVTWGNGGSGRSGVVNGSNSLVGTASADGVGDSVTALINGNYVVGSPLWNNGFIVDAGATTWGSGSAGVSGPVTSGNSLVGNQTSDGTGGGSFFGIVALSNGNYLVRSQNWDNGLLVDAGAVSWGNGSGGLSGAVSSGNSLIGLASSTNLQTVLVDESNETFFGRYLDEGGGRVRVGSMVYGLLVVPSISATSPPIGTTVGGTNITITGSGFTGVTSVTIGGVPVAGFTISTDTSIIATIGARAAGTVDVIVTTPAGSGTGVGIFTYVTAQTAAAATIAAAGLTGLLAALDATPFDDGVENILKYAFNMNLAGPDSSGLAPGGEAGLPSITTPDDAPPGTLCFEFVRRIGSGLNYTPQKSTSLDTDSWSPLSATPVVTPILGNDQWERVTYEEPPAPIPATSCFGRVEVSLP